MRIGDTEIRVTIELIPGINYKSYDYNVGDLIDLSGSFQADLNGIWRIERVECDKLVFSTSAINDFQSEIGLFIVKRAPIGGGKWKRYGVNDYRSIDSELETYFTVDDSKTGIAKLYIRHARDVNEPDPVIWRKNLKLPYTYYRYEPTRLKYGDDEYPNIHWLIIGDNKRFLLTIAYKHNSKTFTQVLSFGDYIDVQDESKLKTFLSGFEIADIYSIGVNLIFAYPQFEQLVTGEIAFNPIKTQRTDYGWIKSDKNGELEYVFSHQDAGQHRYMIVDPKQVITT